MQLLAVRDAEGRTAATVARQHGHAELADLLDAHTPNDEPPPAPASPASSTPSPTHAPRQSSGGRRKPSGGAGAPPGELTSGFERWELTCLIDVLSALGDRRDPPLTAEQASCVAKLGSALFAARLNQPQS